MSYMTQPSKGTLLNFIGGSQEITFYEMGEDGITIDGTTVEQVVHLAICRLQDLNNRFSCRENSLAITKLEEALLWLNKRTEDRKARGVEGKHLA